MYSYQYHYDVKSFVVEQIPLVGDFIVTNEGFYISEEDNTNNLLTQE